MFGLAWQITKCASAMVGGPLAVRQRWRGELATFKLGDEVLPVVEAYRYVGVDFELKEKGNSWKTMAERVTKNAERAAAMMRGAGCVRAALMPALCTRLYMTMVRSQMEYAVTVWQPTKVLVEKMEVLQRQFIRRSLGLPKNSGNWMTLSEFGVTTLETRRDLLRLRYFAHLVSARSKLLRAVFRSAAESVDQGEVTRSPTARIKEAMLRYGFEEEWKSRSVEAETWRATVAKRVMQRVEQRRAGEARTSVSLARYVRRNPEFKAPVSNRWAGNTRGQWLKRRLRLDCLPLLEVVWRDAAVLPSAVNEAKRRECVHCGVGPEDESHFLDCGGFDQYRARLLRECDEALEEVKAIDRFSVMMVLRGRDREAAHDVMLGATHLRPRADGDGAGGGGGGVLPARAVRGRGRGRGRGREGDRGRGRGLGRGRGRGRGDEGVGVVVAALDDGDDDDNGGNTDGSDEDDDDDESDEQVADAERVHGERISKGAMRAVHDAVCRYLVRCWRERARWYGGVPYRGDGGVLMVEPDLWESLRCLRRGAEQQQ